MLPIYLIFFCFAGMQYMNMSWSMPPQIPVHFNASGEPDKWMTPTEFGHMHWIFVLLMSGIFIVLSLAVKHMPRHMLPIPNKEYWLAKERADRTVETLVDSLTWMAVIAGGFVIYVDNSIVETTKVNARAVDMNLVIHAAMVTAGLIGIIFARLMLKFRQPPPSSAPKTAAEKEWDEKK